MLGKRPVMKFLHRDNEELYDLENDPQEVNNLVKSEEPQHMLAEMCRDTNEFRKRTNDLWMECPLPSGEDMDSSFA
jgi:N-sulfoglucosamine sulfohydrolase